MNQLLKWSIENSNHAPADSSAEHEPATANNTGQTLNSDALSSLLGGPSDADLMKEAMSAITSSTTNLDDKLSAFDDFEQLIENLDNANSLTTLALWDPLKGQLHSQEADLRRMAAWCIGTAAQNNFKAQERVLATGALPTLVMLALEDQDKNVRRKAVYALSSAVRNCQPALDAMTQHLPAGFLGTSEGAVLDAGDMEQVDGVIGRVREKACEHI